MYGHAMRTLRLGTRQLRNACVLVLILGSAPRLPASEALDLIWPEVESHWSAEERAKARGMLAAGSLKVELPVASATPVLIPDPSKEFLTFVRPYWEPIAFNTIPSPSELERPAQLAATPGEREPISLGIFPVKDGEDLHVRIDDLRHEWQDSVASIPASAWNFYLTRNVLEHDRKAKRFSIEPGYLEPTTAIPMRAGRTRQLWGFVRVPARAPAGNYRGHLRLFRGNKEAARVEVTLQVYPFELHALKDVDFGWFYHKQSDVDREIACLAERGCNAISFPVPKVVSVSPDRGVELDFSELEPYAEACLRHGMKGRHLFYALTLGRRLMKAYAEFSPPFNAAFQDAMRQILAWGKGKGLKLVAWVVDEPREREINPWNRNYKDTLAYLRLFEGIEGATTMVSIMRDHQHGMDYTPMMEHMDILFTHPWEPSARFVRLAREQGKPCISYNSTRDRLSFGLGAWRMGAAGRWQWHYSFLMGAAPFGLDTILQPPSGGGRIVYPTPQGPLARPAFELTTEGIDDYRYLYTLRARLAQTAKIPAFQRARSRGQAILDEIVRKLPEFTDRGALERGDEIGAALADAVQRSVLSEGYRVRAAQVLSELSAQIGVKPSHLDPCSPDNGACAP